MKRIAIIMAGGAGERFWPVSRLARPKQLLRLTRPDQSLLAEATERAKPLFGEEAVFIATGKSVQIPIESSEVLPLDKILVEPAKRNTLGCLCWAAASLKARYGDEVSMAVLTADHRIGDPDQFRQCVQTALEVAESRGSLVTIGIAPVRPETGFGYIEIDDSSEDPAGVFRVASFREKPDMEKARQFVESGRFLWNSGMFFWTLRAFLSELEDAHSEAYSVTLRMYELLREGRGPEAEQLFETLPDISVDFAVMEKAGNVHVVRSTFEWDDVGSWDALERSLDADESGNVSYGSTILVDASGNIIYNETEDHVVSVAGLKDTLVVVTSDAVMVCPKADAQRVKEIVARVRESRPELL